MDMVNIMRFLLLKIPRFKDSLFQKLQILKIPAFKDSPFKDSRF